MIQPKVMNRVTEIAAEAETIHEALTIAAREFPAEDEDKLSTGVAMAWHERYLGRVQVVPQLESLVTFAMPGIIDPFIRRILEFGSGYGNWQHAEAAEIFAQWHSAVIRYCCESGRWYCWDNQRWCNNMLD